MTGKNHADRRLARQQYWLLTRKMVDLLREGKTRALTAAEKAKLVAWEKDRVRLKARHPGIEVEPIRLPKPKAKTKPAAKSCKKKSVHAGHSSLAARRGGKGGKAKKQRTQYTARSISVVSGGLPGSSRRH